MPLYLSVIIPAFNEDKRILDTLGHIHIFISGLDVESEVVVVDDGSTDSTVDIVEHAMTCMPGLSIIKYERNRGKGYAFRTGFIRSAGQLVLLCDADLSTPIEEVGRFIQFVEEGADIVIGSRALKDSKLIRRQPFHRSLMGKTFNKLVRLLTVGGISDTQCGFKLFRRDACLDIFEAQRVERFAFDAEVLFLARKKGLVIREEAVSWTNSPESRVRLFTDSSRMLTDLIKVRVDSILGRYDAVKAGRRL